MDVEISPSIGANLERNVMSEANGRLNLSEWLKVREKLKGNN